MSKEEDLASIRNMIGRYGYKNLMKMIDEVEEKMAEEQKSMFAFEFFEINGMNYITSENLVECMYKLGPYIDDFDINTLPINAIQMNDRNFISVDELGKVFKILNPHVDAINLEEVALAIVKGVKDKNTTNTN